MLVGVRVFVAVLFVVLGASFLATTYTLYREFAETEWLPLATLYSHLFIFFPTFGILALCAFFMPTSAIIDHYWRRVPFGRVRFTLGFLAVAAPSWLMAGKLVDGDVPALWWLQPKVLTADRGNPAGCDGKTGACRRVPILDAVAKIREESTQRYGLSRFVRDCHQDPLMEPATEDLARRYCFASQKMSTASECCTAKRIMTEDLRQAYIKPGSQSETLKVHALLLPLKVFFLLGLFAMGLLLAIWRRSIDRHYGSYAVRIERGIIVGALAMLVWPISNHAYLQSASLIYGPAGEGFYKDASPVFSLMFCLWALTIVLFYFRQHHRDIEAAGKIGGGIASAVAVLNYPRIIDFAERVFGSGADAAFLLGITGVLALAFVAIFWGANQPETG